jgi:MerR family transcriptional regulator, light-induced transcriptional regulator
MDNVDRLLRTQQVARALGFSVSTIKRWVDHESLPAIRTEGGHRLIRLGDALRFARQKGLPSRRLEALEIGSSELGARGIDDRTRVSLLEALEGGETRRARAILHGAHAAVGDAVVLADQLVRPVMEQLGEHWSTGSIDVFQEHQASQVVAAAVTELVERAARSASASASAPVALGATPEGDRYTLSVLFGELALREAGWDVRNLGPDLPLPSLALAVRTYRPRLVFLSVNHLADSDRFLREYLAFHQTPWRRFRRS